MSMRCALTRHRSVAAPWKPCTKMATCVSSCGAKSRTQARAGVCGMHQGELDAVLGWPQAWDGWRTQALSQ